MHFLKNTAMPAPICLQVSQELYAEQLQYTGTTSVRREVHADEQNMQSKSKIAYQSLEDETKMRNRNVAR